MFVGKGVTNSSVFAETATRTHRRVPGGLGSSGKQAVCAATFGRVVKAAVEVQEGSVRGAYDLDVLLVNVRAIFFVSCPSEAFRIVLSGYVLRFSPFLSLAGKFWARKSL